MNARRFAALAALSAAAAPVHVYAFDLELIGRVGMGAGDGEIIAYTADESTLAVTGVSGKGVQLFSLANPGSPSAVASVDFGAALDAGVVGNVSSTALDPLGRGFGVATIIPSAPGASVGKLGFFNYKTGAILGTLDVGFHPDSAKFSPDGSKIIVANEAEYISTSTAETATDVGTPGSVSAIDLVGITSVAQVASLTNAAVTTVDFSATPGLIAGSRLNVRNVAANDRFRYIEPEYIAFDGSRAIVSLQDNNALGVFDTATNQWTNVFNLGFATNTIDASDQDGSPSGKSASINDVVKSLRMPDAIATFDAAGQTYVVTANEGDYRPDDGDLRRIGAYTLDPSATITAAQQANSVLGRLGVSRIDSDPDGDGDLDDPITLGTRGFSIFNADTGALVGDSGSLEAFLLAQDPAMHNTNSGLPGNWDTRSDDKGPEPEGLDVLTLPNGTVLLAIGMERQNGIILADITNPASPVLLDYINSYNDPSGALISPEGFQFVSAEDSPTGAPILIVGYEGAPGGTGVGIYAIPEPSTAALLAGMTIFIARRRR